MKPADSVWRPWLITIALMVGAGAAYAHFFLRAPSVVPAQVSGAKTRWYLALRMPAVTSQYESGIETMTRRYDEWLKALGAAGYHPATFSDIHQAVKDGTALPAKSVVLLFDPGLRRTLDIVSPTFKKWRWRAVWLSDETAMNRGHREYITYHKARQMAREGLWDVGLKQADNAYLFPAGRAGRFVLGNSGSGAWVPASGARSLNRLGETGALNRLNVISDWTPDDLINRLDAETPVEGPVFLTIAKVQHLTWGTSRPRAAGASAPFTLGALPERTGQVISWFGTEGIDDARVTARGDRLVGFLSLRFRWDEDAGSGVQVVITRDGVNVQELHLGRAKTVLRVARPNAARFSLFVGLQGATIRLSVDGAEYKVGTLSDGGNGSGFFQVNLFDRIREVAHVSDLELEFDPILRS